MKRIFIILILLNYLKAGILDIFKIKDAQEAFNRGDYNKTIQEYSKIKSPSDEVKYNLGEAYYKMGKYKEALEQFNSIKSKELEFKKLHNIGNALARLKRIDDAIKAYERALKIKEDKDTRYNLELLKKLKKKQQKQNKKDNKQNKKNQQNQNNKQKDKQKNGGNKGQDKQKQNSENKNNQNRQQKNQQNSNSQKSKKDNQNQQKGQKNRDKKDREQKQSKAKEQSGKKDKKKEQKGVANMSKRLPISDMELRKYNKMLDKRGIKTLMLPLPSKGEKRNEENINPW